MNLLFQIQNAYQIIPQPKIISRKSVCFISVLRSLQKNLDIVQDLIVF
jgi:hypothetical protein